MFKFILIPALLSVSAFAFFTSPIGSPTTGKLATPSHEYEIDTWGSNSEVYEFTPRSNNNKTCIFVILDNGKAMSMQCFDKPVK